MRDTVIGVFDRFVLAEDAIRELEKAGIARDDISIVTTETRESATSDTPDATAMNASAGSGAAIGGVAGLILGFAALAIPGAGPIVAAGPLAAALASAGVGAAAGGFLGALTGMNVPEDDANYYTEAVRKGGALILVHTDSATSETVRQALNRSGAEDIGEGDPHSSEPNAAQMTASGARIYEAGLEMNPRKTRFEDVAKPRDRQD